jgi:hypothetical protein
MGEVCRDRAKAKECQRSERGNGEAEQGHDGLPPGCRPQARLRSLGACGPWKRSTAGVGEDPKIRTQNQGVNWGSMAVAFSDRINLVPRLYPLALELPLKRPFIALSETVAVRLRRAPSSLTMRWMPSP